MSQGLSKASRTPWSAMNRGHHGQCPAVCGRINTLEDMDCEMRCFGEVMLGQYHPFPFRENVISMTLRWGDGMVDSLLRTKYRSLMSYEHSFSDFLRSVGIMLD